MESTDRFSYDLYDKYVLVDGYEWHLWHVDIKLRATGERVHQTADYTGEDGAIDMALEWMDDNVDSFTV